ncbi:MAG TPA: ATP-binding protein [Longimicrobiales bacterium]|nr:ATP-binding protein [Longimicrobiales bacterium]
MSATASARSTEAARRAAARAVLAALPWIALVAAVTAGLVALRPFLDKAHVVLAYLLVVLAGSARRGRRIGLLLAILGFLCFNFFLLPPYHTLLIRNPLDWLILIVFLVTGFVAAELLHRAQREAEAARRAAEEIDRLATLGAETLNAGRAEEAVEAVARVIRATLRLERCDVDAYDAATGELRAIAGALPAPESDLAAVVAERGVPALRRPDGTTLVMAAGGPAGAAEVLAQPGAVEILLPLRVRDRVVGVLRLADPRGIRLDPAGQRFAGALAYYAALGVERVHLAAEAQHAEALREADRLKDALLASVSHDLRTPLTTIKALAHELRADGDERTIMIETEADRLNRLVANLLDLSRLDAGGLEMRPEPNAADDLLGAALDRLAGVPRAAEVDARIEGTEPLLGRFDFTAALRALVNLLENALKYSPPGSRVEVVVSRRGGRLCFDVLDRGRGVAAADAERIFEPFFRAPGRQPDVGGAGLGLAIARRMARAQGGDVAYAPRPGGGSIFSLSLPALDLPEPAGGSL